VVKINHDLIRNSNAGKISFFINTIQYPQPVPVAWCKLNTPAAGQSKIHNCAINTNANANPYNDYNLVPYTYVSSSIITLRAGLIHNLKLKDYNLVPYTYISPS